MTLPGMFVPMCQVHLLIYNREFLVNPFLFMTATLVEVEEAENGKYQRISDRHLTGQTVPSLHRLKDIDGAGEQIRTPTFVKD